MQTSGAHAGTLTPGIAFENLQAYKRTFALKAAGARILCDFLVVSGILAKLRRR